MIQLDVKDRKILYYLSKNGRMPHSKLAKLVELSQNTIHYRLKRLQEVGVIKKFTAVTNIGALHLTTFTILLKFNEDVYEHADIIEYFKKHEFADWVVTLTGQWDIFTEFIVKDCSHLQHIVDDIKDRFGSVLNTYKVFFSQDTLRVEHLVADFYKDLRGEELPVQVRTQERYVIDDTDRKVLSLVNCDSSLSYLEMSRQSGLSFDIVRYRVKHLVERGIIVKFFPEISLQALGYTTYLNIISLRNVPPERMLSLKSRITTNPHIMYAFVDTVEFNVVFSCAFDNPDGIDQLSRFLRKDFGDIIHSQEYFIIKEEVLFNLYPKGIAKGVIDSSHTPQS